MRSKPSKFLEGCRVKAGPLGSHAGYGNNGAFEVVNGQGTPLLVIASDNREWVSVRGFEGIYSVSTYGEIKVHPRLVSGRKQPELTRTPTVNGDGYHRVKLSRNGSNTMKFVHVLVAEAFIPNPNRYRVVNHRDGNPANNIVTNLEWCSHAYNRHHAIENGLAPGRTLAEIAEIKAMFDEGKTVREVANILGLSMGGARNYKLNKLRSEPHDQPSTYPQEHLFEHVSVSVLGQKRTPTWDEMAWIKSLFWLNTETVVQLHVPEEFHVNNMEHCLHLWRPIGVEIPLPPPILVGVKSMGVLK